MTATFFRKGRGSSIRAMEAESEGRMPLTRAAAWVRENCGVKLADAKIILKIAHDGEWHHVGKFASRCDYYSTEAAARFVNLLPIMAKLPSGWIARIENSPTPGCIVREAFGQIAAEVGCTEDDVSDIYYGTFE